MERNEPNVPSKINYQCPSGKKMDPKQSNVLCLPRININNFLVERKMHPKPESSSAILKPTIKMQCDSSNQK